jgi:hypothetical protein
MSAGLSRKKGLLSAEIIRYWYRTYPSILLGALGARVDHAENVMF